jgi:uncharacterized protein (TIGR03437 family)
MPQWRAVAGLALLLAPLVAGQTAADWAQKSPQTSPPARFAHAMAYDSAHGQVVLFGGENSANFLLSDTWVWDGANWTQKFPQTSPPAREAHAMVYDSAHGQVVLFGGNGGASLLGPGYLNDTWVWDGANWTQESPQTSPPARFAHAMAYDSAHGQVVLFGGTSASLFTDTWVWDGANWTEKSPPSSPLARDSHAMAYDSARDSVVSFGGTNASAVFFNDTWTWNGGPLAVSPPSINGVVSASDFGGFSTVAPGSWVEIYGSNLAPGTRGWAAADFTGNSAPASLDGVSVAIGGQAAFVDYISAAQVNAQLPSNISTGVALPLTVTTANVTSAPIGVTVNTTEPGLLAPASFKIGAHRYVWALLPDGNYVLPAGAIAGVDSRPARPGEAIVMYGIGFGSVVPDTPAGQIAPATRQLSAPLQILFGQTPAQQLPYAGLAPAWVGLYQFNVVVPPVPDSDLVPLTFSLGGVAGTQTLVTAVRQ